MKKDILTWFDTHKNVEVLIAKRKLRILNHNSYNHQTISNTFGF